MENLAGFYFLLYEYNLTGILYYNGTLSQRVKDLSTNKIQFINLPFNNNTLDIIEDIEVPIITRDYQLSAYEKLHNKQLSILSLPCGMGKTYTASILAKHYDNIIILSPLRYLALQTLEHFKKYLGAIYSPILISLDGKRKLEDINNYIKDKNIISATYDSSDIVIQLLGRLKKIYVIIDEFHNLSHNNIHTPDNHLYKILHYNCNKIFLSATPIKNFMNIKNIYSYDWSSAITNKYICDFNIYIPDKNEDYQTFVDMLKKTCDENIDEKLIKKAYFMLRSMLFNGDKKCICYMTCIEFAVNMSNILIWLSKLLNIDIEFWQIDCQTKKTIREQIILNFKQAHKIAIIINVHILDEGINIPECDSVFITQPSNNMINIIQRMCRANRILDNKTQCNIYLWCKEQKTEIILDYIYNNTEGYTKDKVFIYNTKTKHIQKRANENAVQITLNTNKLVLNEQLGESQRDVHGEQPGEAVYESDSEADEPDGDEQPAKQSNKQFKKFDCEKCGRAYTSKYNLTKHKRLTLDKPCSQKNFNKTCMTCHKLFSSIQACNNHMDGRCKTALRSITANIEPKTNNPEIDSGTDSEPDSNIVPDDIAKLDIRQELAKTQKHLASLLLKLENIEKVKPPANNIVNTTNNIGIANTHTNTNSNNIGTANTNNIGTAHTNNIGTANNIGTINAPVTNYNINITPYDQPNNYIDEKTLIKILKCGFMSVQEFITKIHFNKDHPENHNVYISNKKEWLASYYNGTEWVLDKNNEILDTLYDNSSYYLITKYDELTDELDEPTLTKFGRYKTACDDKKLTKNIKNAIKFILYNKKNIVTDTLKKMPMPPALAGIAD